MGPAFRLPVVVGTGQAVNKDDDRIVHPMDLLEEASRAALDAAGVAPGDVQAILSTPLSALVKEDHPAVLAHRLDARPGPRMVSEYSGAAPQRLLLQACRLVAEGQVDVALVVGGIADASIRRARRRGLQPPALPTSTWSQGSDRPADLPERAWDGRRIAEISAGAGQPPAYFALVQSVMGRGRAVADHQAELGALMAPFTAVAAQHPDLAWFPTERLPTEISTPAPGNRLIAEPYTKLMCSFPTVDMAAALVVTNDSGGRPAVRPVAIAAAEEIGPPSTWPAMDRPRALDRAVEEVTRLAGLSPGDVDALDLYSCFPAAVLLGRQALGLDPSDSRPLTATGGLPYFGGPGASYGLHGLACLFDQLLRGRAETVLSLGVGGFVTDFSVGIYGLEERPVRLADIPRPEAPAVEVVSTAAGPAMVEAMTVLHVRGDGPVEAPVIARLPTGERVGARCGEAGMPSALSGHSLVGQEVSLTTEGGQVRYRLP